VKIDNSRWRFGESSRGKPLRSTLAWDLGTTIGYISIGIWALVLLVLLLSGAFDIRERVTALLPKDVAKFFSEQWSVKPEEVEMASKIAKAAKAAKEVAPVKTAGRPAGITMGSTKEEVIAAQGQPASVDGNTWRYGASEIYFVSDRVVGWKDSPENPLRLR
jgi:hypothetical protein